MLAQHYGLDTDSVYRRQWQQSNKSGAAIQDYLTKIKRRNEVVRECLETIPDDIDAARELLRYGLRATDLEALVALNTQDDGALVLADIEGDRKTNILRLASQVRWESQKELMKSRVKMLYYLDCLDTLEADLLQKSSLQLTSDSYGATPPWRTAPWRPGEGTPSPWSASCRAVTPLSPLTTGLRSSQTSPRLWPLASTAPCCPG